MKKSASFMRDPAPAIFGTLFPAANTGGQTGADRAALDFAIRHNIPYSGWVPKGRKTEDGTLPEKYNLQEMPTGQYSKRTEKNVLDSDGTLIVSHGLLTGGSALTTSFAELHKKPWIHIDLDMTPIPKPQ